METIQRENNLEGIMNQMVDEENNDKVTRRGFLGMLAGLGATVGLGLKPSEAQAKSYDIIAKEAYKIWAKYPEMRQVISMINRKVDRGLIDFAMYPNATWSSTKKVFNNVEKIPRSDMDTPQYWLLDKIYSMEGNKANYDIHFLEQSRGIPRLKENSGVWYFARGLLHKHPDNREADLLKALYIGATGNENGAMPIINGTYVQTNEVRQRMSTWINDSDFKGWDEKEIALGAYLVGTLKKGNMKDKELTSLSLLVLSNYYYSKSKEKYNIYGGIISATLEEKKNIPKYRKQNGAPILDINF